MNLTFVLAAFLLVTCYFVTVTLILFSESTFPVASAYSLHGDLYSDEWEQANNLNSEFLKISKPQRLAGAMDVQPQASQCKTGCYLNNGKCRCANAKLDFDYYTSGSETAVLEGISSDQHNSVMEDTFFSSDNENYPGKQLIATTTTISFRIRLEPNNVKVKTFATTTEAIQPLVLIQQQLVGNSGQNETMARMTAGLSSSVSANHKIIYFIIVVIIFLLQ